MRKLSRFAIAAATTLAAHSLNAQAAALVGTVMRDTLGHALGGGVEVRIPEINSGANTNYLGEFRITRIPPGRYLVTIRSVGYEPFSDSVTFVANQAVTREFVLKPIATQLDPVRTEASGAVKKYHSPMLNDFEERRLSGKGGYFVSDSVLRAKESERLPDVIGRIPGLQKIPDRSMVYIASSRSTGDGGLVFQSVNKRPATVHCYVTIYIDGTLRWQGPDSQSNPPFDLNTILVSDLAGAEFYAGGASLPVQYTATGTSCGVLLLWTRER